MTLPGEENVLQRGVVSSKQSQVCTGCAGRPGSACWSQWVLLGTTRFPYSGNECCESATEQRGTRCDAGGPAAHGEGLWDLGSAQARWGCKGTEWR